MHTQRPALPTLTCAASSWLQWTMDGLLARLKQPADPAAAELYRSLQPLRKLVSFQAAFVAGCYQQAMELGTARLMEKFTFTWQKRLAAFRVLPDGTEVAAPGGDVSAPPEVLVGVIGCGALGTIVVQMLLDAGFAPSQLLVSTRSPQRQQALRDLERPLSLAGARTLAV